MAFTSEPNQADHPGFVFIGDHPAVDFANTLVLSGGRSIDLLAGWAEVANWLAQAGLAQEARLQISSTRGQAAALENMGALRRSWTREMDKVMAGGKVGEAFVEKINHLLAPDLSHEILLRRGKAGFHLVTSASRLEGSALALALVARQIAHFLAGANPAYLHRCANTTSCVLYFYDTTKNHRRQWCSVATCGNRHKVARFRRRQAGSI